MFDDLLRQLERIPKSQRVPIRLVLDDEGYLDRCCPAEECGAAFKVLFEDWREKVPNEHAWCAICGEVAGPHSFNTPDQERQISQQAVAHLWPARRGDQGRREANHPRRVPDDDLELQAGRPPLRSARGGRPP